MIDEARAFVHLSTFYIEHDAYGIEILAALRRAQRRAGRRCSSMRSASGSAACSCRRRAVALACEPDDLRAAGGTVTVYAPAHQVQRLLGGAST